MIRFTLFGVPVSIHPTLWLTLAVLGRIFAVTSMVDLICVLLFIISAFVVLLAHEMGHALVGRRLGGGQPSVYLAWLGGDCTNETARLTRWQGVMMTAAGPLCSLAVGVLAFVVLSLYVGSFSLGGDMACLFALGILPAEVCGWVNSPNSQSSFISLRRVADDGAFLRIKVNAFEPIGSPVLIYALVTAAKTACFLGDSSITSHLLSLTFKF